ncbi:unnamed protein product [Plutella xylostella]|uniref:(diamondback moth) hypothetical protein n=1 Tax=Plutella xylostella TaxID=51655 RepID=A0A8S4E8D1_PLUXY|nr:unnamed protein product [Plutella xylostella]
MRQKDITMIRRALVVLSVLFVSCVAQRSPYAGRRPVGYPEFDPTTTTTTQSDLGNRFGNEDASTPSTTTQRLPIEARGDADLVRRLSKLPVDQQPFWLINWQHYETHRQNPQTYELKPNPFLGNTVNNQFLSNPPNGQDFRPVNSQSFQSSGAGNFQSPGEPVFGLGNSQNVQNFQPLNSQNGQNGRLVTPQGQNVRAANTQNGQQFRAQNSPNGNNFRAVNTEGTIDQFLPSNTDTFFR